MKQKIIITIISILIILLLILIGKKLFIKGDEYVLAPLKKQQSQKL